MRALIRPSLLILEPTRAARPPSATVMLPWLRICPSAGPPVGFHSRSGPPERNSSGLASSVEAMNVAVFTLPVGPTSSPCGFSRITPPLDFSRPSIFDGPSPPTTRPRNSDLASGCWMSTRSLPRMLKLLKSTAPRRFFCRICRVAGSGFENSMPPPRTLAPSGRAKHGAAENAAIAATAPVCTTSAAASRPAGRPLAARSLAVARVCWAMPSGLITSAM